MKQALLEMIDPVKRLEKILSPLERIAIANGLGVGAEQNPALRSLSVPSPPIIGG